MVLLAVISFGANGATIEISSATNWSDITNGSGVNGQPGSDDDIFVCKNAVLTVNVSDAECRTVQLGFEMSKKEKGTGTLSFATNATLTIVQGITLGATGASKDYSGIVEMTAGSLLRCHSFTIDGTNKKNEFKPGEGTLQLTGSISLPGEITTLHNLIISEGTTMLIGNLSITNSITINSGCTLDLGTFTADRIALGGSLTMQNNATLRIGGTNSLPANFANHLIDIASFVEYYGASQTVGATAYGQLTLRGGEKTITGIVSTDRFIAEADATITVANTGVLQMGSGMLKSTENGTASLLNLGAVTVLNELVVERHMQGNRWNLVASPVGGQTVASFLSDSRNSIIGANGASRAMMDYNEAVGWNSYFTNATPGELTLGKGFSVRAMSNNTITFSGNSVAGGDVDATMGYEAFGWNLVGNPYTAPIWVNHPLNGFLNLPENMSAIDPNFLSVYYWDKNANYGSGGYTPITRNGNSDMLAVGQGFFVKAAATGASVRFVPTMCSHNNSLKLKSAELDPSFVELVATAKSTKSTTQIIWHDNASLTLDPGYDAGLMRSGNGLDIYSRLIEDNGVDFMVQAIPADLHYMVRIPIGIDAAQSGEVTFSLGKMNLPGNVELQFEDTELQTKTNITAGKVYRVQLTAGNTGVGRFFLVAGKAEVLGNASTVSDRLAAFAKNGTLQVQGNIKPGSRLAIYATDGRLVKQTVATNGQSNVLLLEGMVPGIYLLSVNNGNYVKTIRFQSQLK